MHDPLAVAFEIKYPWRKYGRRERKDPAKTKFQREFESTYRENFAVIWHKDPELRGSDDSCGWFTPPFNEATRDICKTLAGDEAREPWFLALDAKSHADPVLCERLLFGAFMLMSRCLINRGVIRRPVSIADAQRWASLATHNSIDNFRSSLCFKSGYHSNWYRAGEPNTVEEDKFWREEQARSFFSSIAGWILRERRWWFQKPRWHVRHWQVRIEPLQQFKRWAFSRCSKCGGRFSWGYSPCSGSWDSDGPNWFKGEANVFHADCSNTSLGADSAKVTQ